VAARVRSLDFELLDLRLDEELYLPVPKYCTKKASSVPARSFE